MIKEKIDKDLIEAMKTHDETKVLVLRMLKSAIKNAEIQKQIEAADEDVLTAIQQQIKSRRDSIALYAQGGRQELADKEQTEIDILAGYLPEQMTEVDVRTAVRKAIEQTAATGIKDMGKVMGVLVGQLRGKADPSMISQIVKEELSK